MAGPVIFRGWKAATRLELELFIKRAEVRLKKMLITQSNKKLKPARKI